MNDKPARKSRPIFIAVVCLGVLVALWALVRVTGIFNSYRIPTTACEPKYEVGDLIFVSNIPGYQQGDFVCYKDSAGIVYTSQCIALAGDTIEIKASLAYVNEKLVDDTMKLKLMWLLPKEKSPQSFEEGLSLQYFPADSGWCTILTISDGQKAGYSRRNYPDNFPDPNVWKGMENNWNRDWFGPYIIPDGYVFLLSPNRPNAFDSRYRGPIRTEDIIGTNLN
jgi:signal peptidase I